MLPPITSTGSFRLQELLKMVTSFSRGALRCFSGYGGMAKRKRIKTGLMQDLLTRGIDEHGSLRSEYNHEFKDSPLGRIPVEWQVSELGGFAALVTSGSRGWAKFYSPEGAIFLRIGNLT